MCGLLAEAGQVAWRIPAASAAGIVRSGPGAGRDVREWETDILCASEPDGLAAGAGALPGARRRREAGTRTHGPGPRACLALLAAAALLALAAPAQAQTEVWSATITPQLVSSGGGFSDVLGCDNASSNTAAACSETSVLSDDDFTYNSTTYVIRKFTLQGTYATAAFDSALTDTDDLYFRVTTGTPSLPSSHRYHAFYNTVVAESGASFGWSVGNINPWRVDRDVSLAILHLIQPPRPTGLTATANGQFQIDLAWTAPDNPGGLFDITGYQIEASSDGGTTWFFLIGGSAFDLVSTATTYSDTGLEPGTTRHYRVETKNHAVSSVPLSDVADATATTASTNTAPTVANTIPNQTATVGTAFSYAFLANTFADTDAGDTLTYTATKSDDTALPSWLSFAAATRTFSGTPPAADVGTVSVKVTASDGNGGSVSDTFDIVVSAAAGVTVSKSALTVTEEDTTGNTYTVVLDTLPTANVTVTVAGHGGTDVTLTPSILTFTTANWNLAQTVTVKAGNDTDTTNDTVTLTHSAASTDSNYGGITIGSVVVTVADNDSLTAPGAPTGLAATASGPSQIDLSWSAPASTGGSAITGYKIEVSPNGTSGWTDQVAKRL